MTDRQVDLPSFDRPPLIETALGVQFEPLSNLDIPRLGLLWQRVREHLPVIEQQQPLDPVIERIGVRQQPGAVSFQVLQQPPLPRCWFLKKDGGELLQVQQDRIVWNWRKISDEVVYPRYETIRPHFVDHFDGFLKFIEEEKIGDFRPNQCEVIYVNHIHSGEGWETHADVDKIFLGWSSEYKQRAPLELETTQLFARHIIYDEKREFLGRLYLSIEPAFQKSDDQPMFIMKLTARGKPLSPDREGVLGFIDLGRQHIVKTFDAVTTQGMHNIWRKIK